MIVTCNVLFVLICLFFLNVTSTIEIYTDLHTLSLLDALPISPIAVADHVIGAGETLYGAMCRAGQEGIISKRADAAYAGRRTRNRSEEHTSELQSLMRTSYAVICLKKKKQTLLKDRKKQK